MIDNHCDDCCLSDKVTDPENYHALTFNVIAFVELSKLFLDILFP